MKKIIGVLLIPVLMLSFASCKPKSGAGTTPTTPSGVQIPNKFQGYSKSSGGGQVSFKVKIRVQTLDGSNNATLYSSTTLNVNSPQSSNSTLTLTNVSVPSSGVFVIQLWEDALDCHWNDSHCTNPSAPAKNSYFGQQTYQAPLNNVYFTAPLTLDDWDCC